MARDAKILATFHKVKDKKGNEKNVLISLSIIMPAKEMQKEEKEKKEKVKKQEGKKQEQRKQ
ncbi:MAG: hypothetical protein HY810_07470 [Candidatus Omnitrophica bacterium]|nr:hypothetical protein [Candidatus Omnitrophota bacterium]